MAEVLVEHDYVAKESNELTITKGDVIKDVIKKQGGWWEGTFNNKRGLFPDNFVKVIDKDSPVVLRDRKDVSRIRQCRVVFSYKQDHEDELNLNVGDIIDILGEEEEGWWRGLLHGKEGVFPSNFVEEIIQAKYSATSREIINNSSTFQEPTPPLFLKPSKILCEVKFAYKAQNDDELTLKEGDLVTLVSKDGQDPGWWKGELNGVVGVFPDNFVSVLPAGGEKEEKKPNSHIEGAPVKVNVISAQRKSHDIQNEKVESDVSTKTTPPVPTKKPAIVIKKSPSGSGPHANASRKSGDAIDGAFISRILPPKTETHEPAPAENAFDDVHRRPLLSDLRASRPKAPGRRPPSIVGKDIEPGVMNGDTDHNATQALPEIPSSPPIENDQSENKPKLREWEKHQAPWLAEMKLNQAKRGSSIPLVDTKLKFTSTEKSVNDSEDVKSNKIPEKEASPTEKSSSPSAKAKTPSDFPNIRNKTNLPAPARPQTIQNIGYTSDVYLPKQIQKGPSPINNKLPSPVQKPSEVSDSNAINDSVEDVSEKKYLELVQRVSRLEELLGKQHQTYETAIEELRGKLQIETELRMKLQVKFEKFSSDSAIQQL